MQNVPEKLTEVIREMICHEIDVIVSEENEWFMELVEASLKAAVIDSLKEV